MLDRAVQELLHQAVRAPLGRPGCSRRPAVDIELERHEMHRDVALPLVADRVRLAVDLEAPLVRLEPAVPELAEERQEPLVPRQGCSLVRGRHFPRSLTERLPVAHAGVPRPGGRLVQPFARVQVVRVGRQPRQARVAIDDACQQVHRQQQAGGLDGREGVSHAGSHSHSRNSTAHRRAALQSAGK